ncbi:MAG: hypothetical protein M3Q10_16255 [Chloroflexota bacterium]|nr:hypothetical protein [Chloroflexota bacterium]
MEITRIGTAIVRDNVPWVRIKVEADAGVTGLGEADWGVGVAELVEGTRPITESFVHLNDRPGHRLPLCEDVARAHLKPRSSFFGDGPHR